MNSYHDETILSTQYALIFLRDHLEILGEKFHCSIIKTFSHVLIMVNMSPKK